MSLEIRITLTDTGELKIVHPDGPQELRDCVYLLELAKGTLMARSLAPKNVPSVIFPKRH